MSFAAFFERARTEAERYGPDPWVFVRELLQNARDAGATQVDLRCELAAGFTRVSCRDDGEGMSFEHASDYLFTLYRSSKESDEGSVGKFGVGFWSILRFGPDAITIRSRHRAHPAWEITLREGSPRAASSRPDMQPGTELLLERAGEDAQVLRRLRDAAVQNGRYLTQRDHPERPLTIRVQGEVINQPFVLGEPSVAFAWKGVRGVVALGDSPRVELFSRGLRVRAASCLEDLLSSDRASDKARVQFPNIDGVLAPQAILESDQLELLLARSDAREDESLRKLVRRAQKELRRLVRRQLAALRPPSLAERIAELLRSVNEAPVWAQVSGAMLGGALIALLAAPLVWQLASPPSSGTHSTGPTTVIARGSGPSAYHDLSGEYFGPQVTPLDPAQANAIRLRYSPAELDLHLGALSVSRLDGRGPIAYEAAKGLNAGYPQIECADESTCVSLRLDVHQGAGTLRVPVPVGHALVANSLRLIGPQADRVNPRLSRSLANEALLEIDAPFVGALAYQTTPADELFAPAPSTVGPPLGPELNELVEALAQIADEEARVRAALTAVRSKIRYSVAPDVSQAHADAISQGESLTARALRIGAGDCDVQNGILALVLAQTGLEARLVVGLVGRRGQANPWLHAWTTWRGRDGRMRFADASEGALAPPLATQERPPLPDLGPLTLAAGGDNPQTTIGAGQPLHRPVGTSPVGTKGTNTTAANATTKQVVGDTSGPTSQNPASTTGATPSRSAPVTNVVADASTQPQLGSFRPLPRAGWAARAEGLIARSPRLATLSAGYDPRGIVLAMFSLSAFVLLAGILALWMFISGRRPALAGHTKLGELLQGALRQPQAFRHLPELFTRRLVPTLRGSALSLADARTLARNGQLYAGARTFDLPTRAAKRGTVVIDLEQPEGRAVAGTLGAVDLHELSEFRSRSSNNPLTARLEGLLRDQGCRWEVRIVEGLGRGVQSIDLEALGLASRRKSARVLLIDGDDPVWARAQSVFPLAPASAAFGLLEDLLARLDTPASRRAELLSGAAAAALLERHASSSSQASTTSESPADPTATSGQSTSFDARGTQ